MLPSARGSRLKRSASRGHSFGIAIPSPLKRSRYVRAFIYFFLSCTYIYTGQALRALPGTRGSRLKCSASLRHSLGIAMPSL